MNQFNFRTQKKRGTNTNTRKKPNLRNGTSGPNQHEM
jgi:hypothetical protein